MSVKSVLSGVKSVKSTIVYCFYMSWKASKLYTFMRLFMQISTAGTTMLAVYMSSQLINLLSGAYAYEDRFFRLVFLSAVILALGLARVLSGKASEYINGMHNEILQNKMSVEMISKSLRADLSFFDSAQYYDAFASVSRDIYSTVNVVWNVVNLIGSFITLIGSFIILAQLNLFFGLLIAICMVPSTVMDQRYTRYIYKWGLEHINNERQMSYYYQLSTDRFFAQEVRLYNIGDWIKQRYSRLWNEYFAKRKAVIKKRTIVNMVLSLLPEICVAAMLFYISYQVMEGARLIGDYTLFSGILLQFSNSMYSVISALFNVYNDKLRIDNVKKFEQTSIGTIRDGNVVLQDVEMIEFADVSFTYPETDALVLDKVSFSVGKGDKVCIVGVNGAGKSTIIKLLLRFYDVTQGQIRINGIDIAEYDINSLRKRFTSFLQQIITYAFTIRENIRISDMDNAGKGDSDVLEALKQAEALDIISKTEQGLDSFLTTVFEDDGLELSQGQRQRMSLARTFYKNSSVIVLDEASSSLDPEAEHRIYQTLGKVYSGKTTIFTSHRLSNVYLADRIILIENGAVIEQGTHEELMACSGRYAQLYRYQADKFNAAE